MQSSDVKVQVGTLRYVVRLFHSVLPKINGREIGTPILNGPLELYAYFKFLSVPYTGSYRVFKANYYGKLLCPY